MPVLQDARAPGCPCSRRPVFQEARGGRLAACPNVGQPENRARQAGEPAERRRGRAGVKADLRRPAAASTLPALPPPPQGFLRASLSRLGCVLRRDGDRRGRRLCRARQTRLARPRPGQEPAAEGGSLRSVHAERHRSLRLPPVRHHGRDQASGLCRAGTRSAAVTVVVGWPLIGGPLAVCMISWSTIPRPRFIHARPPQASSRRRSPSSFTPPSRLGPPSTAAARGADRRAGPAATGLRAPRRRPGAAAEVAGGRRPRQPSGL
jgi:hypothetical protein